ncbi:MAG: general secretion pathway protein GspK [Gemmatimonadaceae bacterium]|jgi:hypothetical protein|nr:general secretion pathway protein GspK [Gemmatimonadaceae bacterium]
MLLVVGPMASVGIGRLHDEAAQATAAIARLRLRWVADGCLSRAAAALDSIAAGEGVDALGALAGRVTMIGDAPESRCELTLQPSMLVERSLLPLHADSLAALLRDTGLPAPVRDSIAAALLDWQDADSEPRAAGGEASWYVAAGRLPPRNAPIEAVEELALVRGLESLPRRHALAAVLSAATRDVCGTSRVPGGRTIEPRSLTRPRTFDAPCRVLRLAVVVRTAASDSLTLPALVTHTGTRVAMLQVGPPR